MREHYVEVTKMKRKYSIMFLNRLLSDNKWGGSHTAEENILKPIKWLPPKERKQAIREYGQLIKESIR